MQDSIPSDSLLDHVGGKRQRHALVESQNRRGPQLTHTNAHGSVKSGRIIKLDRVCKRAGMLATCYDLLRFDCHPSAFNTDPALSIISSVCTYTLGNNQYREQSSSKLGECANRVKDRRLESSKARSSFGDLTCSSPKSERTQAEKRIFKKEKRRANSSSN